jgi:probable rRNA maturation factor
LKKGGEGGFVKIFLTTDAEISKLHARFLHSKRATDVMSFSSEHGGEIIISIDTAQRQAHERAIPLRWELTLLAVHGLLHLQGCCDEKPNDWKKMRIAEFETMVKIL